MDLKLFGTKSPARNGNTLMDKSLVKDLKNSSEYDNLVKAIGGIEKHPEVLDVVFALCEYAYSMGEAQGHYDATGSWKY